MPRLGSADLTPLPWGSHLCTFYRSAKELQQLVSSYLRAGLEDQECCLWVLPPSLSPSDAVNVLQREIPHIRDYLQTGQLELIPCHEWYLPNGTMETERILAAWGSKVAQAASRFVGLRVTGDTSWLQSKDQRDQFIAYERAVSDASANTNIIALCTYPAAAWNPDEMLLVMQCHRSVLLPGLGGWKKVDVCCV